MVKSKSGSKGMVKSVESILPKGISLMHVFLAVVLGLMICSFLSESNNVIEGQQNVVKGADCTKDRCVVGLKCYDGTGKAVSGSKKGKCYKSAGDAISATTNEMQKVAAVAKRVADKAKAKTDAAAQNQRKEMLAMRNKWNPTTKSLKIQNKGGMCTAINTKLPNDVTYCNSIGAKTKDGCEDNHPQCEWLDCSNNASFNDPYLKGKDYDHLIKCLNNGELIKDGTETWHTDGKKFDIVGKADKDNPSEKGGPPSATDINNSFQKSLKCNVQTDGSLKDCLQYIPKEAYDKIQDASQACYQGWNNSKYKKAYGWNGNTPILSYSKKDGLKCKNPFYDTTEIQVSDPRLVFSNDCVNGCPCDSGADVVYKPTNDWLKDNIGRPLDDWGPGNRCNVKSYRDGEDMWRCAPTHLSSIIKDYTKVGIAAGTSILSSSPDSCTAADAK